MNDFDFDVVQKKRLVASARKQKNGCKSKKCSLPSDNLTAAQIKAKNGPVVCFNLDAPMSWEDFKSMGRDLQAEYVRRLNSRFSIGLSTIGREMFGGSINKLRKHFADHGITVDVTGRRLSRAESEVWECWLHGASVEDLKVEAEEVTEPVCVVEEEEIVEIIPETVESADFGVTNLAVEWIGEFDARAFVERISRLEFPKGKVRISLEVESV